MAHTSTLAPISLAQPRKMPAPPPAYGKQNRRNRGRNGPVVRSIHWSIWSGMRGCIAVPDGVGSNLFRGTTFQYATPLFSRFRPQRPQNARLPYEAGAPGTEAL